ncbi:MAG: cobyrinic acid a,c-diamide synthase [Actinobacteria bacterium]|nr:cobyrinic acid a,c-diamide synthase [Actinomycetota bacterium]
MSRRASLPGADELFRRTSSPDRAPEETREEVAKSLNLQVADPAPASQPVAERPVVQEKKGPKHDEKVTFYCTADDLTSIERARLELRAKHGIGIDRGKIVRAALAYVLEDFEARSEDSILLRRLSR